MIQRILFQPFRQSQTRIKALTAFVIAQGLLALGWIFSTPSDPDVRRFLGYSAQRWVIIAAAGLITALCAITLVRLRQHITTPKTAGLLNQTWFLPVVSAAGLSLLVLDAVAIQVIERYSSVVLTRIAPLAVLLSLVGLEMISLPWIVTSTPLLSEWVNLRKAARIWGGFLAGAALILWSRFGLVKISNGWYEYGVPLMHEQVFNLLLGAALAGLVLAGSVRWLSKLRLPASTIDLLLIGLIWGAAVLTWSPMPVPQTWMSPKPLPPNYEVYPYSDAALYDSAAQGLVLGTGWAHRDVHYKPFYVSFLALAHAALGNQYEPVIQFQVLVLALFPVMLYLLGKTMHSRLAGILAAAAAVIREYNQLVVASLITTSNSKIMLSELPTALGIAVLLFILALWLKKPKRKSILPILAGAVIGFIVQIRLQTILFLPALIALLFIYYRPQYFKRWLAVCTLIILGFGVSLAPLLFRNWAAAGQLTIEKPGYFERTLSYSFTPTGSEAAAPAESQPGQVTIQALAANASLSANHFVHNLVHTLLILPSGYSANSAWTGPSDISSVFWVQYLAPLKSSSAFWMIFNLALIALGIQTAWEKSHRQALLPLLLLVTYDISSALGGFSGQRFFLPVDWIGYFYFFAGAAWLCAGGLRCMGWELPPALFSGSSAPPGSFARPARQHTMFLLAASSLVFTAGLIYPLIQVAVPVKYDHTNPAGLTAALTNLAHTALNQEDQLQIKEMMARPNVEILSGVALYPRQMARVEDSVGVT
ncbi:MAG: hypothetical protein IH586_05500, partial [Anaerolineaceae bacterium]|nr:hypothetical protein [Anaerolineaceae bacterium]